MLLLLLLLIYVFGGLGLVYREYALNMRGRDLGRCWPFRDNVKKEVAEAILPPISVTKFRWWSHELEALKSSNISETVTAAAAAQKQEEEKVIIMEKICPVCGVFVTATVNAMNAHIDSCLAQTITNQKRKNNSNGAVKPKSRTPKKRSIAEIFAVAPPVETVVEDGGGIIRQKQQLKATSLARTLVTAMKTIKAKRNKQHKLKASVVKNKVRD